MRPSHARLGIALLLVLAVAACKGTITGDATSSVAAGVGGDSDFSWASTAGMAAAGDVAGMGQLAGSGGTAGTGAAADGSGSGGVSGPGANKKTQLNMAFGSASGHMFGDTVLPENEWFHVEMNIVGRADDTGRIEVRINGVPEYVIENVQTLPSADANVEFYVQAYQAAYGGSPTPKGIRHWIGDVTIADGWAYAPLP